MRLTPFEHLTGAVHFWHYQAPRGRLHAPRTIEPGIEEIEVLIAGRGHFTVDGVARDCGPGSSLWYLSDDVVEVTAHERDPYETVVFRFGVRRRPSWHVPPLSAWASADECARFCRRALELFRLGGAPSHDECLCHYTRLYWEARDDGRREAHVAIPVALRRALADIDRHFTRRLDVASLARDAGVSASHLHLLFRRHLGTSPLQLVLERRLQRAQHELSRGNRSVKEICFGVGFNDFPYFCTRFRRHTGLTPRQYRQRFAEVHPQR